MGAIEGTAEWMPVYIDGRIVAAGGGEWEADREASAVLRWISETPLTPVAAPDDVEGLTAGALVEVTGRACGNPMMALLDLVATSIPLVLDAAPKTPAPRTAAAKTGRPSEEHRVMSGLITSARDGLRSSPVVDIVVLTAKGLAVVLPVDRSILGAAGEALLDDGEYRVVGKVSAVINAEEGISLLRRSLLAATGPAAAREMLAELAGSGFDIDLPDPVIDGPALQIVPIAILL